jgi:para-aminobenzoate synthetase component 1
VPYPRVHLSTSDPELVPRWETGFLRPIAWLRCDARTLRTTAYAGQTVFKQWDDPLEPLQWMSRTFPEKNARWIGYLSYDLGRCFETLPTQARDDLDLPLYAFVCCVPVLERYNVPEPIYDLAPAGAGARAIRTAADLPSTFTCDAYQQAVARAIDYIAAGDVFQINLSQRFTCPLLEQPLEIYRRLRERTQPRYGAYLGFDDFALICNSPELFFRVEPDRTIVTRPIKGTRPDRPGMEEELRQSIKDQAELNMIVDLERNDLGRVCEVGSVRVTEPRVIERHPTVLHGVATVEGKLRPEVDFVSLLRAVFPGGSITGAPKIRAMEIIDELEPVRRGPYCGAIGCLAPNGFMQFNIAIRTMIAKDASVHLPVGGGIVADSDPAMEYEETLVKAKAMLDALSPNLTSGGKELR